MPALLSALASVRSPEALDRAALVCCARVRQLVALSVSAIAGAAAAKMTKEPARIRDFMATAMERWLNMGSSFGWPGVIAMAINTLLRRHSWCRGEIGRASCRERV